MPVGERVLRARTVLTDELYVPRAADRQLEYNIQDMGRPGYVLVARQMGKTNLLLRMKRRQEAGGDIVIYVDLSQKFETARACFRHIIDLAIDTNESMFGGISAAIHRDRENAVYDPSLEYTRHLRLLLKNCDAKKLIIVLDEIDSLVNAAYSDTVLAHVRSTYFVRTNYSEFERLTYVLSGVAEPTDLIKDKNISPFNIGEKIYLDDFSKSEFGDFLEKSRLLISSEAQEQVYLWASGNPRMTWDICAALEERKSAGMEVSVKDVDEVVQRLYLASFDRPPVDHIRDLVEADASLRAALIAIRYGKSMSIDERVRSRLYLAGITKDPGEVPQIRSKVIDLALSDAWLSQLEVTRGNPILVAREHYVGGRYRQAQDLFEQARKSGTSLPPQEGAMLGMALYHQGLYAEAISELGTVVGKLRGETQTTAEYHLGSSYLLTNNPKDALLVLTDAARKGSGPYKFPAEILLAAANYRVGDETSESLRIESKQNIVAAADDEGVGGQLGDATVVPSLIYSVAYAAISAAAYDDAKEYLECAAALAPPGITPTILMTRYAIERDAAVRLDLAISAARAIIDNQLHPVDNRSVLAAYNERVLLTILSALLEGDRQEVASELIQFVMGNERFQGNQRAFVAGLLGNNPDLDAINMATVHNLFALVANDDDSSSDIIASLRAIALYTKGNDKVSAVESFLIRARADESYRFGIDDISQAIAACQTLFGDSKLSRALRVLENLDERVSADVDAFWLIMLAYYKMTVLNGLHRNADARLPASSILALESSVEIEPAAEIRDFLTMIVGQATGTLQATSPVVPDKFRSIGRNQKVVVKRFDQTGSEFTTKFKIVEDDLRSGTLQIVRVLPR